MAVAQSSSGGVVMSCTSDFMDDIIFVHKPRLLDVAAHLKCSAHTALGCKLCTVIPVAGQRTHRTTFWAHEVTSKLATLGVESAVYDSLVVASSVTGQILFISPNQQCKGKSTVKHTAALHLQHSNPRICNHQTI